jgi:hypothetical protein
MTGWEMRRAQMEQSLREARPGHDVVSGSFASLRMTRGRGTDTGGLRK